MVKKLKQMANKKAASTGNLLDNALAGSVKDSAQQIWLAGMGAFSKAQEEGGKVFEALVKEGLSLQRKTQAVAEEKFGAVTGKNVAVDAVVDPALIGGVLAKVGSTVYDGTVKSQLEKLRKQLVEAG